VPREATIEAFQAAYRTLGYEVCNTPDYESGFEKIALYALGSDPKHAARQLPSGEWTSKLGRWIDIAHTLGGLEGPEYGTVVAYMKRPQPLPTIG
jgi:hypothetical protein